MKNLVKISAAAIFAATLTLSANAKITIGGNNNQSANVQGAVTNMAFGGSKASQNLSSNQGKVTIGGNNKQSVNIQGAVTNMAFGGSKATQNMSSNSSE
ncbi:hypothetical protein BKK56_02345 [Rodentibacter genomosp. 2]|uniref:hypothetical protein n=1 Tax=Rodentibacter genomosp. 2 TaxID=1908266 RepID=UPI00098696FD|nr:hypothetical protein BKK56_02345 [Rodentibacter genomosp. 2]